MTHDESFAQGFRLAWRKIWLIPLVFVLAFAAMSAIGSYWDRVEIANTVQRSAR